MREKRTHILIIRLSAMGDAAMVAPVVGALRAAHPDAEITILTRPFFQPFFRDVENVGFLAPDFAGRHKGLAGLVRLANDISACGVTHIADMHDVLRTKIVRRMLRFRVKGISVIDKGRADKKALTRKYNKKLRQLEPTVDRYRDTLLRLGFAIPKPAPPQKKALAIPEEISRAAGRKQGVWIGVAPFAQHKGKIYPAAQMAELIAMLAARYKVFIFGGGQYEKEYAEAMQQRCGGNVVSVIGKIKLAQELDLISNLDAMVTMDSSSMHMASLVATPVVSVWGATHPFAGFYGFGQDPANAVQLDLPCRPCSVYGNKPCIYKDYRCMERITPEMIFDRVEKVLGAAASEKPARKPSETTAAKAPAKKKTAADTSSVDIASGKTKAVKTRKATAGKPAAKPKSEKATTLGRTRKTLSKDKATSKE